jgi:hypothetical protein
MMLTIMLPDKLNSTRSSQVAGLPHVRNEINHSRPNLLLEIDRMRFQFPNFYEHGNLRTPNSYPQAAEARTEA